MRRPPDRRRMPWAGRESCVTRAFVVTEALSSESCVVDGRPPHKNDATRAACVSHVAVRVSRTSNSMILRPEREGTASGSPRAAVPRGFVRWRSAPPDVCTPACAGP
eukprot:6772278-Prymnesium_polylepis.1